MRTHTADDGACPGGSVTFHLDAPREWFIVGSGEAVSSQANWLTVFRPSGEQLPLFGGINGSIECTTCQFAYPVALGAIVGMIGDAGVDQTWDGVYFEPGRCPYDGGFFNPAPAPGTCATRRCAAPGSYDAVFCAYPASGGQRGADASCTTVPFDYPATAVCGTLPL